MNDRLPILDLSRAYAEIQDEVQRALEHVLLVWFFQRIILSVF